MMSVVTHSSFEGLKKFLSERGQYPFPQKRLLINRALSLLSTLHIKTDVVPYDVIFILPAPELEGRYRHIIDAFGSMNLKCKVVFFSAREVVRLSFKGAIYSESRIGQDFTVETAFASYIRKKFAPKLICQANDSNYLSTFLKRFSGAKLINIAHCVSCPSANFDILDYHYYFIFGDSSEINLRNNNHTYGSSNLVKTGSLFFKQSKNTSMLKKTVSKFDKHIVFSSQWIAEGLADFIKWSRDLVNLLAERNPNWKVTIKCHPLETDRIWIKDLDNIFVENGECDLEELLNDASFHLTHHSAFALESSVFGVPTICLQKDTFKERCLSLKQYFPVVNNIDQLEQLISEEYNLGFKVTEFVNFHLANIGCEMETFKKTISNILDGRLLDNVVFINGTLID